MTLAGAVHVGETFKGLRLPEGRIEDVEFESCTFDHCLWSGATIARCRFSSCTFVGCDLSNVTVTGTRFRDVKFRSTKLIGIDWTKADGMSERVSTTTLVFVESILDLSRFYGLNLRGVTLERCSAKEVDLTEADLRDATCRGTDFSGARFHGTDLEKTDMRGALNYVIDPRINKVKHAQFALPEAVALLRGLDVRIE